MIAGSIGVESLFDKVSHGSIEADDIIDAIFCITCWDLLSMFYALSLYRFFRVAKDIPSAIYRHFKCQSKPSNIFFSQKHSDKFSFGG